MICKGCGKPIANGRVICPNCGTSMQSMTFQSNRLGEDGRRAEYLTEKLTGKKGVYEGKAHEHNDVFVGLIVIGIVLLIILGIALANYLA